MPSFEHLEDVQVEPGGEGLQTPPRSSVAATAEEKSSVAKQTSKEAAGLLRRGTRERRPPARLIDVSQDLVQAVKRATLSLTGAL